MTNSRGLSWESVGELLKVLKTYLEILGNVLRTYAFIFQKRRFRIFIGFKKVLDSKKVRIHRPLL